LPALGSDFVDYKAQFSKAQSVTPGAGQTSGAGATSAHHQGST